MIEKRISHYKIEAQLGEGAMGRVYRARDLNLDRIAAIKMLGERTLGDPSFLERFRREARLAAQLNHPNIGTIYEFGEDEGQAFIAMEFVEGKTLADLIAEGPLPLAQVRKFGRQAASALAAAHDLGIIHRDIKPANLMVTGRGDLKVMDFGVARRTGETQLTMAGSLVGTANIMAPEMVKGQTPGPAADLFSLGCVLYEALAGRPAFFGDDPMAVLFQVTNEEPPPVRQFRGDVPEDLEKLVDGLLIKDPEKRFGPASAVVDVLEDNGTVVNSAPTLIAPELGTALMDAPSETAPGEETVGERSPLDSRPGAGSTTIIFARLARMNKRLWLLMGIPLLALSVWFTFQMTGGDGGGSSSGRSTGSIAALEMSNQAFNMIERMKQGSGPASLDTVAVARGLLVDAIAMDPDITEAWVNLGALFRVSGNRAGAVGLFQSLTEEHPDNAYAFINLADIQEALGDTAAAESYYRKAMALDTLVVAPNNLAFMLIQGGRPNAALDVLEESLISHPNEKILWKNKGLAHLDLAEWDAADSAFTRALDLDSRYAQALMGGARLAQARQDTLEARKLWGFTIMYGDSAAKAAGATALRALAPS